MQMCLVSTWRKDVVKMGRIIFRLRTILAVGTVVTVCARAAVAVEEIGASGTIQAGVARALVNLCGIGVRKDRG